MLTQEVDNIRMLALRYIIWHQIRPAISCLRVLAKMEEGSYRGMAKVMPKAENCRMNIVCDALILDEESRTDTYPTMEIANSTAHCEHEASVSKVGDEQLFYLMSRGHTEAEALGMIVNGFFEPFTRELPMEYAVELNKLMSLEMEGSIG